MCASPKSPNEHLTNAWLFFRSGFRSERNFSIHDEGCRFYGNQCPQRDQISRHDERHLSRPRILCETFWTARPQHFGETRATLICVLSRISHTSTLSLHQYVLFITYINNIVVVAALWLVYSVVIVNLRYIYNLPTGIATFKKYRTLGIM